jgi:hypothetical protein
MRGDEAKLRTCEGIERQLNWSITVQYNLPQENCDIGAAAQ